MSFDILQSAPGDEPVQVSAVFPASPAQVYKAWTDPVEIMQWFGAKPHSLASVHLDLQVGGNWRFEFGESDKQLSYLEGVYQQIEHNRTLVFTWSHVKQSPNGAKDATAQSQVSITFTAVDSGTRIDLRHQAIQSNSGRLGVRDGWKASFNSLHDLLSKQF